MRDTPCPKHERQRSEIAAAVAAFEKRRGKVKTSPIVKSAPLEDGGWQKTRHADLFATKEAAQPVSKPVAPKPAGSVAKPKLRPTARVKPRTATVEGRMKALQAEVEAVKQRTCEITEIFERLKAKEAM